MSLQDDGTKKHMKNGIERFLQSAIVLPAITEGVSKIRLEETLAEEDMDNFLLAVQQAYIDAKKRNKKKYSPKKNSKEES